MAGGASSAYGDEDDGIVTDINVTPLVDITLVLLIIFMITMPAIVASAPIDVNLPESSSAEVSIDKMEMNFLVRKDASGEIVLYLNGEPTTTAALKSLLAGGTMDSSKATLAADKGLGYGEVVKAIDQLGSLGIKKIALDTKHVASQ